MIYRLFKDIEGIHKREGMNKIRTHTFAVWKGIIEKHNLNDYPYTLGNLIRKLTHYDIRDI
jgi:hypothetical protein